MLSPYLSFRVFSSLDFPVAALVGKIANLLDSELSCAVSRVFAWSKTVEDQVFLSPMKRCQNIT